MGLPLIWRTHLVSAFHTFVPAFAAVMFVVFETTGEIMWTREALMALFISALRAGFKAVSMTVFARTLPDPKDK